MSKRLKVVGLARCGFGTTALQTSGDRGPQSEITSAVAVLGIDGVVGLRHSRFCFPRSSFEISNENSLALSSPEMNSKVFPEASNNSGKLGCTPKFRRPIPAMPPLCRKPGG